ncbi:MAG: alpha-L-glycero-D-manno-heptose alpha-1,3-glucosyltransferase [Syntrophus sp. (in: bacteria)]|nr:alpha-L-glycero-D-manno-heptose alpha-1,3-glucosyltransferase [Syntrophus sp. (in: bacteria)]
MRLLICCEFYAPSTGGVQEVMRQIAERMVLRGHEVTVATTQLVNRTFTELNGVHIEGFLVVGNGARGMKGEIKRYQDFVVNAEVDAVFVKAAQQWTFDALWPVLDRIKARKVFIPCGFSGLYQPAYAAYFKQLPDILRLFDHLIFYASQYRDIDFVRNHGMHHFTVIPNGASETEFEAPGDPFFRRRYNIPEESFLFLTVGSLTGMKGHLELAEAFSKLDTGNRPAVLLLNGNHPAPPQITAGSEYYAIDKERKKQQKQLRRFIDFVSRVREVYLIKGWSRLIELAVSFIERKLTLFPVKYIPLKLANPLQYWIKKANKQFPLKQTLLLDLPRDELVQAFKNADLFVFASNIEYSPLVLFEAAAAGTPFLSVPVGNAEEIAEWTGCGIICPGNIDSKGYTRVSPKVLAAHMKDAMNSPHLLKELGQRGYNRWKEKYSWSKIVVDYEKIFAGIPVE